MDGRQLTYFLAVVDHESMTRAAEAMYLAQPSLSQSIRALERDLGARLFDRVGGRLVLTSAGRELVEPARRVVQDLRLARAAVESAVGLQAGQVVVAAMPSVSVEPLSATITTLSRRHPGISVTVRAGLVPSAVLDMVRRGEAEVGMLASPQPVHEPGMTVLAAGVHRFVVVAGPDAPFERGRPVRFADLAGQRLVAGERGTGMRDLVDEIRATVPDVELAVESEYRQSVLSLVLGGVGVAVLADAWVPLALRSGALVFDLEPARMLNVYAVTRQGGLSPAASALLDCIPGVHAGAAEPE